MCSENAEEVMPRQPLPPEMIVEILNYSGWEEILVARLVCRDWRWTLDHPNSGFIRFNAKINNGPSVTALFNSIISFDNVSIGGVKILLPESVLNKTQSFPTIGNILMQSGNSEDIVINVLRHLMDYTESFKFDRTSMANHKIDKISRVFKDRRFNNLSELIFAATIPDRKTYGDPPFYMDEKHLEGLDAFFQFGNTPNLKKLQLDLTSAQKNEISMRITKFILKFTTFLERRAKTLKELSLFISLEQKFIAKNPCSMCSMFSTRRQEVIASILKLESLDIRLSHPEVFYYLVPPCFWKSDKLTSLTWNPMNWEWFTAIIPNPLPPHPIQTLIQMSQTTILDMTIDCNWFNYAPRPEFDLSWLQNCSTLKRLSLSTIHMYRILIVDLRLPTVTHFNLKGIFYFHKPGYIYGNVSIWITRTFENIECIELNVINLEFGNDWNAGLMELMILKKLKEIRFIPRRHEFELFIFNWDNILRNFCEDPSRRPRLLGFSGPTRNDADNNVDYYGKPRIISIVS